MSDVTAPPWHPNCLPRFSPERCLHHLGRHKAVFSLSFSSLPHLPSVREQTERDPVRAIVGAQVRWTWKSPSRVRLFATPWTIQPWNSPGQNTVGSLSLLQGIFPTQGSNWGLLHCRQILYQTGVSCTAGGFFTSWAIREAQERGRYQNWIWVIRAPSKDFSAEMKTELWSWGTF